MLIGIPQTAKSAAATSQGGQGASADIIDVSTADFDAKVMRASMERPVLLEFWAPWCGPCKQLMPILEQQVRARPGKILMAKVNIDESPELAQAFRVQSVPTVVALFMGQPVTAFAGVRPPEEISKLIDQLIALAEKNKPQALDVAALLKQAAQHLAAQEIDQAHQLYAAILEQDPDHADAYCGLARVLIAAGQAGQAQALVDNAPPKIATTPALAAVKTALDLMRSAPSGDMASLKARMDANPQDPQAAYEYAEACFAQNLKDDAVAAMTTLIRAHRAWEDEKARKQLLRYFEAWGPADPATIQGRKRLSSVLFS